MCFVKKPKLLTIYFKYFSLAMPIVPSPLNLRKRFQSESRISESLACKAAYPNSVWYTKIAQRLCMDICVSVCVFILSTLIITMVTESGIQRKTAASRHIGVWSTMTNILRIMGSAVPRTALALTPKRRLVVLYVVPQLNSNSERGLLGYNYNRKTLAGFTGSALPLVEISNQAKICCWWRDSLLSKSSNRQTATMRDEHPGRHNSVMVAIDIRIGFKVTFN